MNRDTEQHRGEAAFVTSLIFLGIAALFVALGVATYEPDCGPYSEYDRIHKTCVKY